MTENIIAREMQTGDARKDDGGITLGKILLIYDLQTWGTWHKGREWMDI